MAVMSELHDSKDGGGRTTQDAKVEEHIQTMQSSALSPIFRPRRVEWPPSWNQPFSIFFLVSATLTTFSVIWLDLSIPSAVLNLASGLLRCYYRAPSRGGALSGRGKRIFNYEVIYE
jgi:hypothetical protein